MHRHSHARTLMFANAASVLTQAVVRILKFGVLLASSSFTGCSAMSQSTITGLGASTRSVCLSHSLEFWQQQQKFTVARPHLNFICRVFQSRATGAKPNWAFNVDANSGHAFGILLAAVGALRPCGAPAPVNSVVRSCLNPRSGNSLQRLCQMSNSVQAHTSSTRESFVVPQLLSLHGKVCPSCIATPTREH